MTKLLVQVCCAPCCGAVLECFQVHGISPTLFFYNPNIHPRAEYEKRRDELMELADLLGFAYIVPEYDPKEWFAKVKGLEHEPERGARCSVCFGDRLMATALYAKEHGFSHFTTTLATSLPPKRRPACLIGLRTGARKVWSLGATSWLSPLTSTTSSTVAASSRVITVPIKRIARLFR